ncbi:MAG: HaeIII family restriction endonuclease [Eubacteriales bacterium]|nr:HaeIII family restriction endonuclease [Eubacteriales bacterium]
MSLYNRLLPNQSITIQDSPAFNIAKGAFNNMAANVQNKMSRASQAAVNMLLRLEPLLENSCMDTPLYLCIQEDAMGIAGDVRDVLMVRRGSNWEIGLSVKHNHSAVKHSRLSNTIDFGEKWFGFPCAKTYFDEITPIFEELRKLKQVHITWNSIPDKDTQYYIPILRAFMKELRRLYQAHPGEVPKRLMSYLLGTYDFYKVISHDNRNMTQIQAISLYGTLNRSAGAIKPQIKLPILRLPTRFYDISFRPNSSNTIVLACDLGWSVSFRIHNASTYVEPSLKFDVKLEGIPSDLYSHFEPWR